MSESTLSSVVPEAFSVGELVAVSIEGLLNAASAHLGEPDEAGLVLEAPEPQQAWLALLAASALLERLGPMMSDDAVVPFRAGFARLVEKFAADHPDFHLPGLWREAPPPPVANLDGVVAAVLAAFED